MATVTISAATPIIASAVIVTLQTYLSLHLSLSLVCGYACTQLNKKNKKTLYEEA
jgi:hypothetical protein